VAETLEVERPADPETSRPSGGRRRPIWFAVLGAGVAGVLAIVLFVGIGTGGGPAEVAPGIPSGSAMLLQLDVFPPNQGPPAPGFTLTDQHGRTVSLASFRGKSVVLSFNDDRCTDICTLLAQDVVAADGDLGSAAKDVVFLSVNVNPYYPGIADVASWSDQHGLGRLANWEFLTGSPAALSRVWKQYGVEVQTDSTTRSVVHSTELYFIDPGGAQRAIGSFGTASADTDVFAHALAQMADDNLPGGEQVNVGGPSEPAPTQSAAAIGASVPSFSLPVLGESGQRLASSALRGRYTVVNFWSSTCGPCVREMPAIEAAYRDLGAKVNFVGVDVADNPSSASRFARMVGASYPLVSDSTGEVAGTYRIAALPFTAIISPHGVLESLHPGTFSTEQLEYVVGNLDPSLRSH
jgi:cytochrome oxidase Cu insertion factor (SCO1/SenC/PrrC family)